MTRPEPSPAQPSAKRPWQPKHRRLAWLCVGAVVVCAAAFLVLSALQQNLTFFYSPADLAELEAAGKPLPVNRTIRLGGMVAENSMIRDDDGLTVNFVVTDYSAETPVRFSGILPDLFREGQGVVAIGILAENGHFTAEEILAKHDENYMPPEVAAALERGRTETGQGPQHRTDTLIEGNR